MVDNLEAVYENGAFRPLGDAKVHLTEGTRVRLTVESVSHAQGLKILDLAADVYAGLSAEEVLAVEEIALDRRDFFGNSPGSPP
jgi:predicted DNA-binding antitoxin AbrB/MazE fold protein